MAYKDILVHVDNSRACPSRLAAAADLAQAHGAHLTGLYVVPTLEIPGYLQAEIDARLLETQAALAWNRAREAETVFGEITDRLGLSAEWRTADGGLAGNLNLHGRYADIIVLGQVEEDDPMAVGPGHADRVVLESGRPVLVIPYIGLRRPLGKRVMVCWNAGREAVRAVNDALPFLERAERVEVVAVNPVIGDAAHGEIPSADICLHLARHGVSAVAHHLEADDIEVGDVLLSRVADEDIDLLVMGAYGHSRFREIVLGGATRHLLRHMTVPVLMSH